MARLTGFVGDVTGKMGNMVAYTRRGVNLARQYQPNVTNPNTKRQQRSRRLFTIAHNIGANTASAVIMGYSAVSPTYERQNFVGKLLKTPAITLSEDMSEVMVDWSQVPISWGPLIPLRGEMTPNVETPQQVKFPLTAEMIADANCLVDGVTPINCLVFGVVVAEFLGDCILSLIGYKSESGKFSLFEDGIIRTPASWSGENVHVYAFCKQSPTPKNGISMTTLPPRIRYRASFASYLGQYAIS